MSREKKIRLALFGGAVAIILIVSVFLWLINENISFGGMLILSLLSVAALAVFFLKGQIFDHAGEIQTGMISIMLVSVLILVQIAFGFNAYANNMAEYKVGLFNTALETVDKLDNAAESEYASILRQAYTEEFDYLAVISPDGTVRFSSDAAMVLSQPQDGDALSFVLYSGDRLLVRGSDEYARSLSRESLIGQLTVLITSLLFSIEFVVFVVRKVSAIGKPKGEALEEAPAILSSVRQVAFIFYFASRLSASFIPTLAKSLPYYGPELSSNMLAALPQTAETLFVCISILFTSRFMEKKGWKLPFMAGLTLIFAGTMGCLLSKSLLPFVGSRMLIGFGYGFCWMTLRSIALLGKSGESRAMGFSMLNAGLYAGMYCGSTVGSILASKFSYSTVFILSVALIAACGLNILSMANSYFPKEETAVSAPGERFRAKDILSVAACVLFLIAPGCIIVSYSSYFLPLFYDELGRSVLDVGRVQLLYGIIIVYLGPAITRLVIKKFDRLLLTNVLYLGIEIAALLLVGVTGTFGASVAAMILIGVGDSFGFGVQNNFYLGLPVNERLGSGKSLMYLSLIKKLTEMLGPAVFALAMGASAGGVTGMAIVFALMVAAYVLVQIFFKKDTLYMKGR